MWRLFLALLLRFARVASYSEYQCRYMKNVTEIVQGCKQQAQTAKRYQPLNSSIYYVTNEPPLDKKYQPFFPLSFFDPHRDGRYYKDLSVPSKKRHHLITKCFREFTNFAAENNLPYWLVHGGLIGWYWNEQTLPWDMDIDVSVLYYDIKHKYINHDKTVYKNRYLFEINPNSQYREKQTSDVIDARFIDKLSGLYIDITGVSYDPEKKQMHCKTPHYYDVNEIFPLKEANFSNVKTWIPNNPTAMLKREYGADSMYRKEFERGKRLFEVKYGGTWYKFDDHKMLWELDTVKNSKR